MTRIALPLVCALSVLVVAGCSGENSESASPPLPSATETVGLPGPPVNQASPAVVAGELTVRLDQFKAPKGTTLQVSLKATVPPRLLWSKPLTESVTIEAPLAKGGYMLEIGAYCATCSPPAGYGIGHLAFESRPQVEIAVSVSCAQPNPSELTCEPISWAGNAVPIGNPPPSPTPPTVEPDNAPKTSTLTIRLKKVDVPPGQEVLISVFKRSGEQYLPVAERRAQQGESLKESVSAGSYVVATVVCRGPCKDGRVGLSPLSVAVDGDVKVEITVTCRPITSSPGVDCSASRMKASGQVVAPSIPPSPPVLPPAPVPAKEAPVPAIGGTDYHPAPRQGAILANTISPRVCSSWMGGSHLLSICDAALLNKSWKEHTLTERVPFKVTVSGRKVRVGSTIGLVQVGSADGRGSLQAPAQITLEGKISTGSYLFVSASSYKPSWIASGQALFSKMGMEKGGRATIGVKIRNGQIVFDFQTAHGVVKPLLWTHSEGPGWKASLPPLPGGYARTPAQAARTYLAAINARDGKVICQLLTADARKRFTTERLPCWSLLGGYIGYSGENAEADFHHLELLGIGKTYRRSSYGVSFTAVPVRLRVYSRERQTKKLISTPINDVVWVRKVGEDWRLGKTSSLLLGGRDSSTVPDPYASTRKSDD